LDSFIKDRRVGISKPNNQIDDFLMSYLSSSEIPQNASIWSYFESARLVLLRVDAIFALLIDSFQSFVSNSENQKLELQSLQNLPFPDGLVRLHSSLDRFADTLDHVTSALKAATMQHELMLRPLRTTFGNLLNAIRKIGSISTDQASLFLNTMTNTQNRIKILSTQLSNLSGSHVSISHLSPKLAKSFNELVEQSDIFSIQLKEDMLLIDEMSEFIASNM
jgi:hypothetical protein